MCRENERHHVLCEFSCKERTAQSNRTVINRGRIWLRWEHAVQHPLQERGTYNFASLKKDRGGQDDTVWLGSATCGGLRILLPPHPFYGSIPIRFLMGTNRESGGVKLSILELAKGGDGMNMNDVSRLR